MTKIEDDLLERMSAEAARTAMSYEGGLWLEAINYIKKLRKEPEAPKKEDELSKVMYIVAGPGIRFPHPMLCTNYDEVEAHKSLAPVGKPVRIYKYKLEMMVEEYTYHGGKENREV